MHTTLQKTSPRWVGAPGPTGEERGKPVRSDDGEPVAETGEGAAASLPMDRRQDGAGNMQGGAPFIHARMKRG
jgi:hypothetical protein